MKAAKGNKEYAIDESQQKAYQDAGFDILDDDGNTIAYGKGKTVPFDEYMQAVKEIERLQTEKTGLEKELDGLKADKKPTGKKTGE